MNVPVAPPKVMTGNRQLTRGAFIRNDFLRNPHFRKKTRKIKKITYLWIFFDFEMVRHNRHRSEKTKTMKTS